MAPARHAPEEVPSVVSGLVGDCRDGHRAGSARRNCAAAKHHPGLPLLPISEKGSAENLHGNLCSASLKKHSQMARHQCQHSSPWPGLLFAPFQSHCLHGTAAASPPSRACGVRGPRSTAKAGSPAGHPVLHRAQPAPDLCPTLSLFIPVQCSLSAGKVS